MALEFGVQKPPRNQVKSQMTVDVTGTLFANYMPGLSQVIVAMFPGQTGAMPQIVKQIQDRFAYRFGSASELFGLLLSAQSTLTNPLGQ